MTPFSSIFCLTFFSLSLIFSPVYLSSYIMTGAFESAGLSFQIISMRSSSAWIFPCFFSTMARSLFPHAPFMTRPSNPRQPPSLSVASMYPSTVGTPSSPIFLSSIVVSFNCFAACTKYLPSVQSPASSIVMTAVPAEPVNPVMNLRALKCSPTYSDS